MGRKAQTEFWACGGIRGIWVQGLTFKGLMEQISRLQKDHVGSHFSCKKTGELSAQTGEALAKGKITPMRARMEENARQDRDQNSTNILETPTLVEHTFNPCPPPGGRVL